MQLDGCQAAGVWLQDLHVANAYSPPGHDRVAVEMMGQYFIQEGLEHKCWTVVGDFNEEQDSSFVYSFLQAHGGQAVGSATRWDANRAIDWAVQRGQLTTFEGVESGQKLSDHQGFWLLLPSRMAEPRRGRLKPCSTWKRPENLSKSGWQTLLSKAWQKQVTGSGSLQTLGTLLELNSPQDARAHVQQEWDLFMLCLNQCFQDALSMACNSPEQSVRNSARTLLKQTGRAAKGRPAVFQWVPDCTRAAGDPSEGENVSKLRRKLARTYEVKRLVAAGKEVDPRLLAKLLTPANGCHDRSGPGLSRWAAQEIVLLKEALHKEEQKARSSRLTRWKQDMNQGSLSKLGTWLKNKQTQTNKARLCRQGVTAETRAQATSMVCDHWKDVWAEQRHVNVDEAVRTLVQGFGPVQDTRWAGLTALDLHKAMCSAKGSAGPDGWAADEIRHLPFQVCELLFQLTRRWEREGLLPLQLKQARQVTLTKPAKIQADGTLQVKHTRPISVCSIFWRIYASAWASNQQLQQWASQHFHPRVVYGKGSESAEACAARLQDAFTKQGGYMATLDWTSAFDRMQPEITARALVELGLPAAIPKLLLEAWGSQQRFISFEGHTHEHVLMAGKATPQGCPLAPFILSLWVSAGTRAVEQDVQDSSAELSCMDDRTFYSRRWEKVTDRISAWQGWSRTMGMQEAPDKVQICARGKDFVTARMGPT